MTLPMGERELADVWSNGASRGMWTRVLEEAVEAGRPADASIARDELDRLPHPLVALEANADLVRQLTGCRWYVMQSALEGGSSWEDVADALHLSVADARAYYLDAIEKQERHVPDLHNGARAARARAVLDAGTTATRTITEDGQDVPAVAVLPLAEKDTREGDVHSARVLPAEGSAW
jgi:hypothetical protein